MKFVPLGVEGAYRRTKRPRQPAELKATEIKQGNAVDAALRRQRYRVADLRVLLFMPLINLEAELRTSRWHLQLL
jgi:hypothetical protein